MRTSLEAELKGLGESPAFQQSLEAIRPGKFRRDGSDPAYEARAEYTRCLRRFVYDPASMNEVLTRPELKELFFRTFGYRGTLDFTIYPGAWLRDLPLLDIGEKAYLGDGIVLGTNQVSPDQSELRVGPIKIGHRTLFDQACMVGQGTTIGADCQFGIRSLLGIGLTIGDQVRAGGGCGIIHLARIGDGVTLGHGVIVGQGARVDDGVTIPGGTSIPPRTHVTQRWIESLPS